MKTMTCPVCNKTVAVAGLLGERLRVHGPKENRCGGGGKFGASSRGNDAAPTIAESPEAAPVAKRNPDPTHTRRPILGPFGWTYS